MFISNYEDLRNKLLSRYSITSLIQLEYNAFEPACVPVCTFILTKTSKNYVKGGFIKLSEFKGHKNQAPKTLEAIRNPEKCNYLFHACSNDFKSIPGEPIAYWITEKVKNAFSEHDSLTSVSHLRQGLSTTNNDRFIRFWHEPQLLKSSLYGVLDDLKWRPINKGGSYRKWFGNNDFLVNWECEGQEIKLVGGVTRNSHLYFKKGITWSSISSSNLSARIHNDKFIFSDVGQVLFNYAEGTFNKIISFLNSCVSSHLLSTISPTLHFHSGYLGKLPANFEENLNVDIEEAIKLSKQDWDSFETSWDFQTHPLVKLTVASEQLPAKRRSLKEAFQIWEAQSETNFQELKRLEEENNRYWIDAYGLQDELTPEVPDGQITIRRADLERDIKSLISYAVGCMMGRYSLDAPGLIHAGQPFDPSRHTKFPADNDAILPITDQAYFDDDIVSRFVEFVKVAFGPETLTENLDFIANALKLKSGETAQDRIRRYFVTEFISDHIRTYKKRPIYWLFTSGKKRAFGALVYLHRYTPDTVGRIRTDYILELQVKLDKEIERLQAQAETATTTAAKRAAAKRLKDLQDQQLELRDYQAKVQTFGDRRIALDLDDGVAYNYTRFKGIVYEGTDLKMKDLEAKAQWKLDLIKEQLSEP